VTDLPLQPGPQFWTPATRRLAIILVLVVSILLLGWLSPARSSQPRMILGGPGLEGDYARTAHRLICEARQRVWATIYVVRPDDGIVGDLLKALAEAAARGVDVRVCVDSGERDGQPDTKNDAAIAWLRGRQVRVVTDEHTVTSHAKLVVVDGRFTLAGSHNWTRAALTTNREASWLVDDTVVAREAEAWLAQVPGWQSEKTQPSP